jgi:orotate phosphoribosyltransferase
MENEVDIGGCRQRLLELLKTQALSLGNFKLSSGKESDYYIDGKRVTLTPEGAFLTAVLILDALRDEEFDALGGPTLGADPIVGAVAALSWLKGKPVKTFIVRKNPKKHGTERWIEGPLSSGDKVVIVEDVVTTGKSAMEAIKRVEEIGCEVVKVVALVDRMEGAGEKFEEAGYRFQPLFTAGEIRKEGRD